MWRLTYLVRPLSGLSAGLWGCALELEAAVSGVVVYAHTHAMLAAVVTGIGSVLFSAAALTLALSPAAGSRR